MHVIFDKNLKYDIIKHYLFYFLSGSKRRDMVLLRKGCQMTTKHVVADDVFGQIARRQWELQRRVLEGTLDLEFVLSGLQSIIEERNFNEAFTITVNYDLSLQEMIATGKYDLVNCNITQNHFPLTGNGKIELLLDLVHFGKTMSIDNVLQEFDRRGLRSAILPELIAFGAKFPEKQREFPIVALGSVWTGSNGYRLVPYLYGHGSEGGLYLHWYDYDWRDSYRFLAFRK